MKKALIVGLNNYPGRELEWCNNDAIAMKEWMDLLILKWFQLMIIHQKTI